MPDPGLYRPTMLLTSSPLFLPAGNLRGYNLPTPNLTGPSLTVPQLATPNLQQFFPQATRQSLLGAPPVGVPINPSQINLSGRTPQKQARTPSSTTPNRKVSDGWGAAGGDGCGKVIPGISLTPATLAHTGPLGRSHPFLSSVSPSVKRGKGLVSCTCLVFPKFQIFVTL